MQIDSKSIRPRKMKYSWIGSNLSIGVNLPGIQDVAQAVGSGLNSLLG